MNDKILSIFDLCLQLNPTRTLQEVTGNKPTVFFDFSGHVAECEIRIHTHGWKRDAAWDVTYRINTETGECRRYPSDNVLGTQCEIDDCIAYLEGLL